MTIWGLLGTCVLIIFKLIGLISWPWWAVTAPLWSQIILTIIFLTIKSGETTLTSYDIDQYKDTSEDAD